MCPAAVLKQQGFANYHRRSHTSRYDHRRQKAPYLLVLAQKGMCFLVLAQKVLYLSVLAQKGLYVPSASGRGGLVLSIDYGRDSTANDAHDFFMDVG